MELKPITAWNSGESTINIEQCLDENVFGVIASTSYSPKTGTKTGTEIVRDVLAELGEMHVPKEQTGLVILDTFVFLRNDIECILNTVIPLAKALCQRILECGSAFRNSPPEITIFLGNP